MERSDQVGKWKIVKNDLGGINFMGPKGEILYLAPYASQKENNAVIEALPKYVREYYFEHYRQEE
ncbi:MAG: hypothetical protein ACLFVP_01955 [Candidatus Bathyarchaeia archaeon]